jgi:hypothetical protein
VVLHPSLLAAYRHPAPRAGHRQPSALQERLWHRGCRPEGLSGGGRAGASRHAHAPVVVMTVVRGAVLICRVVTACRARRALMHMRANPLCPMRGKTHCGTRGLVYPPGAGPRSRGTPPLQERWRKPPLRTTIVEHAAAVACAAQVPRQQGPACARGWVRKIGRLVCRRNARCVTFSSMCPVRIRDAQAITTNVEETCACIVPPTSGNRGTISTGFRASIGPV